jgi:hypothetical protein
VLPDDDLLAPGHLAAAAATLDQHPRAGLAHTAFDLVGPGGETLERGVDWTFGLTGDTVEPGPRFLAESMRIGCRVCPCTALVRTAALPERPIDAADFPGIDFGLWLRIALRWDVAFLARPLASYRLHDLSETAAYGGREEGGYAQTSAWIDNVLAVKLRFLAEHGAELDDASSLRREARRAHRRQLVLRARKQTLPERRLGPTLRALGGAVRANPLVLRESAAWRLLGGSLVGPRLLERLKRPPRPVA